MIPSEVLKGGGEMGALMRSIDWTKTVLGRVEEWPHSLRTTISTCLSSRFPILVWWGPQLVMLYNDAFRPILGTSKHPFAMGTRGIEVWPEIWHIIGPMLAGVLERGEATWSENQLLPLHRRGFAEECYFTFSFSPIRDESGAVSGIFTAVTETTRQVVGERRLQVLRRLAGEAAKAESVAVACELAAKVIKDAVADVPWALIFLLDSAGAAALVGSAGIAAHALPAVLRLDGADSVSRALAAVARSGTPAEDLSFWGRLRPLFERAQVMPSEHAMIFSMEGLAEGKPAGLVVLGLSARLALDDNYRDFLSLVAGQVSRAVARAHAFEEEKRRGAALAKLDRAKTHFFSSVSHEFRTPLTLLLGPVEEGLRESGLAPKQHEQLERVHRNALRLLKLVNTLLDFCRVEAGRKEAHYQPTDLAALTADLASSFRSLLERAGLRLRIDCQTLSEPVFVDREMYEKIVLNLLSNAFKFTVAGEIRVTLDQSEGQARLVIADTGVGVPEAELPHIFDRFYRRQGGRGRTFEGSGIGLALVQELVRLHHGTIDVESRIDRGSRFAISLPLGTRHLEAEQVETSSKLPATALYAAPFVDEARGWLSEPPANAAAPHDPLRADAGRVLLVDDNADMRDYICRALAGRAQVEAVADGRAALARARAHPPDLVLSEVMMPGLDGFGLLRELRHDPCTRSVPIVLLSARAGEEARLAGMEAGADDYLVKPFSARELVARVTTHLQLARARASSERERERLYSLFMTAPAIICILRGPEHRFELANAPCRERVGARELLGKALVEALPELQGQGYIERLDEVYRTGRPYVAQEASVKLDHYGNGALEELFLNVTYQPSYGADGRVEGILVFAFEVTEQIRARQALQRAQERLDFALEVAGVGFWDLDLSTRAVTRSPSHDRIYGYPSLQATWTFDRFLEHVEPDDRAHVVASFERAVTACEDWQIECSIRRADGVRRRIAAHGRSECGLSGKAVRMLGVVFDVTERKEIEAEREARLEELARTVRFSDLFIGILGHDLRNPLSSIHTGAELLILRGEEDVAKRARRILNSAARMRRMIDQLLDLTRVRLGRGIALQCSQTHLVELSRQVIDELEGATEGVAVELTYEGDPGGLWDRDRLAQLVSNLVGNALEHRVPGTSVKVRLDGTRPQVVRIAVLNQGTIGEELLPEIFEPFRTSEKRRSGGKGLGLGLFITREIVLAHGGTICVDTSKAGETGFVVELPRQRAAGQPNDTFHVSSLGGPAGR